MNKFLYKTGDTVKKIINFQEKWPVYTLMIMAPVINIIVEILSRRSFLGALKSIINNPAFFVINSMIIFITELPSLFVKRRYFVQILVSSLWLGFAIANFILMGYRTTPLSAVDLKVLPSVFGVVTKYLNTFEIILIIAAFAAGIFGLIQAFRKVRKCERNMRKAIITASFSTAIFALSIFSGYRLEIMPESVPNLAEAYKDYGFAWCFSLSVFDRGISKPDNYSDDMIDQILSEIETPNIHGKPTESEPANIVFVQLESFFDVSHLKNVYFSQNPTRVFNALKTSCPSGFLTVPVFGAGTVNTEFEVLTGMSLDYFGTGEYPYNTVLKSETCETMAYNLRERGYASHVVHNNNATFYGRNVVFSNMGFDTFTSMEYMNGITYNPLGWANDDVMTGEIMNALKSTAGPDFVYGITVQAHGKYPRERIDGMNYEIQVTGADGEGLTDAYEYYAEEIKQTDAFIGQLVKELSGYDEPVVLVLYGDHLPSLDIEPEMLDNGDVYQTEYVIWSNYGLKAYDKDMSSYELSAYVMGLLGYDNGILTKMHQTRPADEEEYQKALEALEYDMLYGNREVYGGGVEYEPTQLQMGVRKIAVTNCELRGEAYFVYGNNFTPWSEIYVDGKKEESIFVDSRTLILLGKTPPGGSELVIKQESDTGTVLSEAQPYVTDEESG